MALVDSSVTSYTHTAGITSGTTYVIKIAAVNVHGEGAFGSTTTIMAASVPGVPTSLTAGAITSSTLDFSWTASADNGAAVSLYTIYQS